MKSSVLLSGVAGGLALLALGAGPSVAQQPAPAGWLPRAMPAVLRPPAFGALVAARPGRPAGWPAARGDSAAPRHVFLGEMVFGSVGSLAGFIGGGAAGLLYYEALNGDPYDDDFPGEMYLGGVAGSIVGTALGTHFGARLAGGRGGHFGRRLGGAALGLLAAGGAIELWHGAPSAVSLAVIPLTQALVTTLLSPRE